MSPSRDNDWIIASDELRARKSGAWAKHKLSFLDQYLPAALQATGCVERPKRTRYYIDLFAGPGLNVDKDTGEEFAGSSLRALTASATSNASVHFTHAVVVNKDEGDHAALRARIQRARSQGRCPIDEDHIGILNADANVALGEIMRRVHRLAYAFVFVDITRPKHLPWETICELKRHGHKSVDLYLLFPLHMGINRLTSWKSHTVEQSTPALNRFYGTTEWREIYDHHRREGRRRALRRDLLDLYMNRLRDLGWNYVKESRNVMRRGNIPMYKMIFATNHDAGASIGEWVRHTRQPRPDGQQSFDFLDG